MIANKSQIQQVVLNLALNARDAMPSGGELGIALMTQRVVGERSEQLQAFISVSDTGTGIDDQTLGSIREPYFTTKPRTQGTGLGLAIVESIVSAHGGALDVESVVGQGSTFTIMLNTIDPGDARAMIAGVYQGEKEERGRILLLQDQGYVQRVLESALETAGYNAVTVDFTGDGEKCDAVAAALFDLVVVDYDTVGQRGLEWVRALRTAVSTKPVIIIATDLGEWGKEADDPWMLKIEKPVQIATLISLVRRMFSNTPEEGSG